MSVTVEHEAPLEVLERFPELLPQLLREHLGCAIPAGARMWPVPPSFNLTTAPEFRADGACLLGSDSEAPACAAIVESQRSPDADKPYSWPYYLGALHHKYRCPTYLIVIAIGEDAAAVAAWARRPIATFQPGSNFAPLVIGPPNLPPAPTIQAAKADLPRAVLSSMMHLDDPDGVAVVHRTLRAAYEAHGVDTMVWMYRLIRGMVSRERFTEIERLIMLDVQKEYFPITAFEREHFDKGKAEGRAAGKAEGQAEGKVEGRVEGKAEALLAIFSARGLRVSDEHRTQILACRDSAKLDRMIVAAVSASTVSEILAAL